MTVKDGDITDTFLLQPSSEAAALGSLETDASFAWTREEGGKVSKFAVREGKSLKANGAVLMQANERRTTAVEEPN